MKCKHGIMGRCAKCQHERDSAAMLKELAKLVLQLGDSAGLDTSGLEALMRKVR